MAELPFASAVEAAEAIRQRRVSSEELTRHILERIERFQPSVNAYTTVLHEQALAAAREADGALRGGGAGPLLGVPVSIKDSFAIRGVRTTAGMPALADHVPSADAVAVERLRRAGAIILGHTNVPEMLVDFQSFNELFGTTNNPWDLQRTPGGSTGGGAAAVALGLGFLELGSDLGGSIRVPAHFCGVFGHRPTLNLVPLGGHVPPLPGAAPLPVSEEPTAGPLARSARDLELALRILGGPAAPFNRAYRWVLPPPRARRAADLRIGYVLDDAYCPVSSDTREVLAAAVERLRAAGVGLEEGWPAGISLGEAYAAWFYLLNAAHAPEIDRARFESVRMKAERGDGSPETIRARAWTAPYRVSLEANHTRLRMRAAWEEWFRAHDAFLMPVAFTAAFRHDHTPGWNNRRIETPEGPRPYHEVMVWPSVAGLTGHPATVAPVGLTASGLPVGIQIVGPFLEDATPIAMAGCIEEVLGGFQPPPRE